MQQQTVISAARVLVGPKGELVSPGAVLITGEVIAAVGSPTSIAEIAPRGARRLDYPEATILPGLIDAHVHLAFDASSHVATTVANTANPDLLDAMAARATGLLDQGITTVRDLGDRDYLTISLREQVARGEVAGPRILTAGAPLTTHRGHCWFLGGEVTTLDQIRAIVARHAEAGVDCIKVMVSGGRITAGTAMWQSQFTSAQLAVIVEEAARVGLPVAAHAHATASIVDAAAAGVNTIEHCSWMTDSNDWTMAEPSRAVVRAMAERGIAVCPTILPRWPEGEPESYNGYTAHKTEALRCYRGHGVPILPGTDAGATPLTRFDGYSEHLELYRDAGIPPAEVIDIATADAASILGIQTGTIRHGYSADLVVVHGNPVTDLADLRKVALVVARGRIHEPRQPSDRSSLTRAVGDDDVMPGGRI